MRDTRSLGPWLRRFLTEHIVSERNLALNTQRSYRDTFALLLPFVSGKVRKPVDRLAVRDVSAGRVRQFLAYVEDVRGCSVQTRNQRLAVVRTFARFVANHDPAHIEWCAEIRAVPSKRSMPEPLSWLSLDEIEAMLSVPNRKKRGGRTEHALLLFLYNTGARVSEAAQLKWRDLVMAARNGRHPLATIHGKGGKVRQCPLWPRTASALEELVVGQESAEGDAVFLSRHRRPYTRFGVYRLVERCAARVPALAGRKVTPHVLRHTTACHLLKAGVDINTVRAWLGHERLDTTNIYAEVDLEMKAKALALADVADPTPGRPWKEDKGLIAFLKAI